jgi:hypothetical protein
MRNNNTPVTYSESGSKVGRGSMKSIHDQSMEDDYIRIDTSSYRHKENHLVRIKDVTNIVVDAALEHNGSENAVVDGVFSNRTATPVGASTKSATAFVTRNVLAAGGDGSFASQKILRMLELR